MARPRTGQLVEPRRDGLWRARVTVERDGKAVRELYSLATADRATAERRLEKLQLLADLTAGRGPEAAAAAANAPETVAAYAESIGKRLSPTTTTTTDACTRSDPRSDRSPSTK